MVKPRSVKYFRKALTGMGTVLISTAVDVIEMQISSWGSLPVPCPRLRLLLPLLRAASDPLGPKLGRPVRLLETTSHKG
jgi:hypothetical protein